MTSTLTLYGLLSVLVQVQFSLWYINLKGSRSNWFPTSLSSQIISCGHTMAKQWWSTITTWDSWTAPMMVASLSTGKLHNSRSLTSAWRTVGNMSVRYSWKKKGCSHLLTWWSWVSPHNCYGSHLSSCQRDTLQAFIQHSADKCL